MFSGERNITSNETLGTLRNKDFPPFSDEIAYSAGLIFCLMGVLANLNNLIAFTRPEMKKNPLNFILTVLAISDLVFSTTKLVSMIIYFAVPSVEDYISLYCLMYAYGQALLYFGSLLFSLWLNVLIGVFRLSMVAWPLREKTFCTLRRTKIAVSTVAVLSITLILPTQYLAVTIQEFKITQTLEYVISTTYIYGPLMCIVFALPVLIVIAVTLGLIRSMYLAAVLQRTLTQRSAASVQTIRMTRMLTVILTVFVLTNAPTSLLFIAINFGWFDSVNSFYLLQDLDKTTTFFVYFIMCRKYRCACRRFWENLFRCKVKCVVLNSLTKTFCNEEHNDYPVHM